MAIPANKRFSSPDEAREKLLYESVSILRENEHFKLYLSVLEELGEKTKDKLLVCKNMEDVEKLQMYYSFLSDLLRYAYIEEPNPEPPTNE